MQRITYSFIDRDSKKFIIKYIQSTFAQLIWYGTILGVSRPYMYACISKCIKEVAGTYRFSFLVE